MFLSILDLTGRFHPLFVHLPIGILLIAVFFQIVSWKKPALKYDRVLPVTVMLGGLAAVFSCVTGYLLSQTAEYDSETVGWHQWLGIATAVISFCWYQLLKKNTSPGILSVTALIVLCLLMFTGHLGGTLTHGEGYLSLSGSAEDGSGSNLRPARIPLKDAQQALAYKEVVEPVFSSTCYSCHGDKKQKGKLRLDLPAEMLKGGKNGKVIEATAEESELLQRMLLPIDDKKHMPPKDKPQPTKAEIELIHWWIESGASFDKKVFELSQPDKIKPVLKALEKASTDTVVAVVVPDAPVEAAPAPALEALKKRGVVVVPVAVGSNYLTANFVSAPNIKDEDLKLLIPLSKQLISLKVGGTKIGDPALVSIAELKQLVRLQLDYTNVTDEGLKALSTLAKLRDINLVGTSISAKGVMNLKPLVSLKNIFLYKSAVEHNQWPALKQALPNVKLDSGGYVVPILQTDTTRL
ncbi:MAG: c-type cytochrome domain-containing protein [Flavitalea sp.]